MGNLIEQGEKIHYKDMLYLKNFELQTAFSCMKICFRLVHCYETCNYNQKTP